MTAVVVPGTSLAERALEGELLPPDGLPSPALPAPPPPIARAAPAGGTPWEVRRWYDEAAEADIPVHDGTLATARLAADAYARRAKAANTRRAYRAGVRAWCDWCEAHGLPSLPARAEDVAAFLADERLKGRAVNTVELRRAAIRSLHFLAGLPVPTAEARVGAAVAGMQRDAAERGELPRKKQAATVQVLREILALIPDDLAGLRDRALLLFGFAGALRRAELAAVRLEHVEARERGLRLTLPLSKGERAGGAVQVAIPYGTAGLCPVRALRAWLEAAGIREGAVFRRVWVPPTRRQDGGPLPCQAVGTEAIDAGTVARIVKKRAAAAGYDPAQLAGHSLKRGALTTGMDRGEHPTKLKRLGRHRTYAVLDEYLELGDPFEGHPLGGVL